MTTSDDAAEPRWLDAQEAATWQSVWTLMTWLPARLDVQLRRDSGLSLAEYQVLSQISMAPDGRLRLSDLARMANVTLSHLSRLASRLEGDGLLTRSPDPDDGRTTLAQLTRKGRTVVEQAAPAHVAEVRRLVFDGLTPAQSAALGDAAGVVAEALRPDRVART